jgi:hypothetical protein
MRAALLLALCCLGVALPAVATTFHYLLDPGSALWTGGGAPSPISGSFTLEHLPPDPFCGGCDPFLLRLTQLELSTPLGNLALPDSAPMLNGFAVASTVGAARFVAPPFGASIGFQAPLSHSELMRTETELVFESTYLDLDPAGPNAWTPSAQFFLPGAIDLQLGLFLSPPVDCSALGTSGYGCASRGGDPERLATLRIVAHAVAIPEPGTGALLGAGLVALAAIGRPGAGRPRPPIPGAGPL